MYHINSLGVRTVGGGRGGKTFGTYNNGNFLDNRIPALGLHRVHDSIKNVVRRCSEAQLSSHAVLFLFEEWQCFVL